MSDFNRNDTPEAARVIPGQQLLFTTSPRNICEEIGLDWWAALKLRDDGWISFSPEMTPQLDEAQDAELRFLGSLVVGGCDPAMLGKLLQGLEKPYSYRDSKIYYDWSECRWRLLPERSIKPEAIFADWIDQLKDHGDAETLRRLADEIEDALSGMEPSELQ